MNIFQTWPTVVDNFADGDVLPVDFISFFRRRNEKVKKSKNTIVNSAYEFFVGNFMCRFVVVSR